ncbi:RidA family protein [Paracoccus saliphilus]|nr:RidA family protein [Paracoccus saliphilus]SIS90312.1 Enamine deaminase RidA, house cleaning of reactive enamine intermediates, YjgF/YER057c/UK114 family [Paracoccus saliphilus]
MPVPQGDYVPASRHGGLIYTAGMTPRQNGRMMFDGPVRTGQIDVQREAVRLACTNALLAIEDKLRGDEEIAAMLTMTVYVAAEDGFSEHSKIADFASAFLRERLGDRGICSRCAIGVANLPGNAPVEIQLVAAV